MTLLTITALAAAAWARADPGAALPRGSAEAPLGEPAGVTAEGVQVVKDRGPDGKPTRTATVGWDRVREVTGPLAEEARRYAGTADKAWRARARLERGDWVSAEPLFEELFAEYRGGAGPTSLMVAGGLVRCRLARGAQTGAVEPWISWVRGQAAGGEPLAESVGVEVSRLTDAGTGLIPGLPPMWLAGPAVESLASVEVPSVEVKGPEGKAAALLALYITAARAEVGMTAAIPEKVGATADPGVRLVYDIVKSRVGDEGQRRDARRALTERLNAKSAPWVEAWCRLAVGRSLAGEKAVEDRRLGVASLAYVASRSGSAEAYLTGLALAEMALALSREGEEGAATALANEAADRFPQHPALDSPRMARWMLTRAGRPKPAETKNDETPGASPGEKGK